jgi:hypothetical protein
LRKFSSVIGVSFQMPDSALASGWVEKRIGAFFASWPFPIGFSISMSKAFAKFWSALKDRVFLYLIVTLGIHKYTKSNKNLSVKRFGNYKLSYNELYLIGNVIVATTPLLRGGAAESLVAGVCSPPCWLTHPSTPLKRGVALPGAPGALVACFFQSFNMLVG